MSNKRILGKVSREIAEKWNILEHENKVIVLYDNQISHCEKHIHEFLCMDEYKYAMRSLGKIILEPDYVYYDDIKKGLEYYKKLNSNVLVVIRVSNSKELKMRSIYPVKFSKIEGRKRKDVKEE